MKRGIIVGITAGAVALAIAGGIAFFVLGTLRPSPEEAAEAYLRALSEGDASSVRDLLATEPESFSQIQDAFAGADSYLSNYSYEISDDHSVRAEVDFDGVPGVVFFGMSEGDGGYYVTSDYLATLDATTTLGDSVMIGSAVFPTSEPITLLPAVYTVAAAPSTLLAGEATVLVTNESTARADVVASLSDKGAALIASQLDDYARACAEPGTTVPESCGLRVPWAADLATLSAITFRIDQLPVLALAEDLSSFAATDGIIVATATGTTRDGASASFTYRADDWALRGVIEFSSGRLALRVT